MRAKSDKKIAVENKLVLQLFVSGMSPNSMQAIENIKRLCNEQLKGYFDLEIIDIYKNPESAKAEQIIFSPSLVKQLPLPKKILIGNFSDTKKVLKGLGIQGKN